MNAPFFIVGLPRTRSAWLANFLTWGSAFCLHDGLKECAAPAELKARLEQTLATWPGDADPCLPLFFPEIHQLFPAARYVFVERDAAECEASYGRLVAEWQGEADTAAAFARLVPALAAMRQALSRQHCLTVKFADLDREDVGRSIWEFCLPALPFHPGRWRMLHQMNVQVLPRKVVAALDRAKLGQLWNRIACAWPDTAPVAVKGTSGSELHNAYAALLQEMCGPDHPDACAWLQQLLCLTVTWDHIRDNDPIDKQVAATAFEAALLDWPANEFWQAHRMILRPVLANAISAWLHSDRGERIKAYDVYSEVPCAVAFLLGGVRLLAAYSPRLRALVGAIAAEHENLEANL